MRSIWDTFTWFTFNYIFYLHIYLRIYLLHNNVFNTFLTVIIALDTWSEINSPVAHWQGSIPARPLGTLLHLVQCTVSTDYTRLVSTYSTPALSAGPGWSPPPWCSGQGPWCRATREGVFGGSARRSWARSWIGRDPPSSLSCGDLHAWILFSEPAW